LPRGQPFGGPYPGARGKAPTRSYFNYIQMPQTIFGRPIMPQPIITMPYPRFNTISNTSQNLISLASQVPSYQPGKPLGQPMQQIPFQGIPFQVKPTI